METAPAGVRHPKGPAKPRKGPDARAFLAALLDSSVGAKLVVGLSGAGLVGFVIFHMVGNLKFLSGRDAINGYAYFLQHEIGALLWVARGGLLALFLLHLALALRLNVRSAAARPVAYRVFRPAQARLASRTMVSTGVVVLLFTLYHLAHFTFGWVDGVPNPAPDPKDPLRHDVYGMMVAGFSDGRIVGIYLAAQVVLFVHLRHGIPSMFQTLGIKNARFRGTIDVAGTLVALAILVGNAAIVLAVKFGWVRP